MGSRIALCYILVSLAASLGLCAPVDNQPSSQSSARKGKGTVVAKNTTSTVMMGGQGDPQPAAGGLSSGEKVSRLLVEGRRKFQDGDYADARNQFQEALRLDDSNAEARKYLTQIDRRIGGKQFDPSAALSSLPAREPRTVASVPRPDASQEEGAVKVSRDTTSEAPKASKSVSMAADAPVVAKSAANAVASEVVTAKTKTPAEIEAEKAARKTDESKVAAAKAAPEVASVPAGEVLPGLFDKSEKPSAEAKDDAKAAREKKQAEEKQAAEAKAAEEKRIADQKKAEKAAKEAEEKRLADQKKAEKQAEEKRIADQKKADKEAKDAEDKRIADQKKAEKEAEEKRLADQKKAEREAKVAEEKRIAEQKKADQAAKEAEEKRIAEEKKAADAAKIAEAKKAKEEETAKKLETAKKADLPKDEKVVAKAADQQLPPIASKSSTPQVESDNLLRQAQKELQNSNRDAALTTAKQAAAADPNNVEAKALVAELEKKPMTAAPVVVPSKETKVMAAAVTPDAPKRETGMVAAAAPATAEKKAEPVASGAEFEALLKDARTKREAGKTDEAIAAYKQVLKKDPNNEEAKSAIAQLGGAKSSQASVNARISSQGDADQAEASFLKGLTAYEAGRLDVAVQWWNYTLTISPNHARAIEYLQRTRSEYDAWVQQHQHNAVKLQKEVASTEKLDTGVTYDTAGQKSLVEFLSAMSLITDVNFYVADGVDPEIRVTAKFEDTPLNDALDIVLLPIGLKWSRTSDVITVTPDLRTKFFNLTPDQVTRLKAVMENKTLQRILYGPEGAPPMRNVELALDDRQNMLMVTDSQENISKVEAFLKDMQSAGPPGLIFKSWKIRPEEGNKIKALVEAVVRVQSDAPYDLERRVLVDGEDLIVKDTAENIAKVEELLLDKNFIKRLENQKLQVATFNLTPRTPIDENVEQARDMAQNVVTVVKTILYSQSTESAAAAEGRRYWYDPNTLTLTVTDYPDNLQAVSDYIRALAPLGKKQKSDIVFLKHQTASELSELINRVLGLASSEPSDQGGSSGGQSVTKTLRPEGELTFRDLRIRVTKINQNDVNDKNDDDVEMVLRTPTTSEDRTIKEFRSEFIDDYEINVIEVRPSGNNEGSARIEVRYNPQSTGVAAPATVTPQQVGAVPGQAGGAPTGGDQGTGSPNLTIDTVENMNALLIRYDDPGDLAEVKGWIEQLDIPVLQVSIETKLVEVNETRAKEWMPEFSIAGLGKSGIDFDNSNLSSSFANFSSELRNPFDPFANELGNAGLLKGTQVLSFTSGGETPLNFTLRTLEAEGVLTMVNGPHVLVENGQTADFEIDKSFQNLSGANQNNNNNNSNNNNTNGSNIGNNVAFNNTINQVQLSVEPQITQLGEIRLDIQDLELQDAGQEQGTPVRTLVGDLTNPIANANVGIVQALTFDRRRRSLSTTARCRDGGTIVLGGWTGERNTSRDSGVPILRNIPYIGKIFFNRTQDKVDKTTLLIFLTCNIIKP
ncbi:MAG: tetratricopeptide repeat protein [Candidatus Sumerlaeaceae bacterium]|nr:tetratricopeptide repeat protein [Candidatus Sumerlaeaceae bacterium]